MTKQPSTFAREVRGIAGHGALYAIAALASRCIGFLMIPVYTHHIDPAGYGVLEMAQLVTEVTAMVFAFGLANAAMRFYAQAGEDEAAAKRVISTAQLSALAAGLVGSVVLFLASSAIAEHLFDGRPTRLVWYLAGSTLGAGISGIPLAYLRIKERSKTYVGVSLGQFVAGLTLNILFVVVLEMGAEGVLLSGLITQLGFGLFLTSATLREVGSSFARPVLGQLARFGAPLLLSSAGTMLMTTGDRFIVKELAGLDEVGLYGLGYKLGFIVQLLMVGPFFLVWQPRSYAIEKDPAAREVYARVFTLFFALLVFGATCLSVLARDMVQVLAKSDYHSAWQYVPWIAFACVCNGVQVYCRIGIFLKGKTEQIGVIMLVTAIGALTASWFATGAYGAKGAAIVTFSSYAVLAVAMSIASRRMYAIPYERGRIVKVVASAAAAGALAVANPFDHLALSILWKSGACAAFVAALLLLRFFTVDERRWALERAAALRARRSAGNHG